MTSFDNKPDVASPAAMVLSTSRGRKQLLAAGMGNVLEYYDFVVYAFLATTIARRFFPGESEVAGLLAAFGTFGVGFLARPLGGAIIGRIGDRKGRRTALLIAVFGMAVGTVGIGLLPTYSTIGSLAPVLLVSLRLLQGLCAGGGWGSATAFIIESAPPGKRGFYGGIGQACITSSTLLGSTVAAIVNACFSPSDVDRWAWRIPFLFGAVLVPIGLYMRRNMEETPAFVAARRLPRASRDLNGSFALMAQAFGFTIIWTVSFYVMLSYMPTFTAKYAGLTSTQSLLSNAAALAVLVAAIPFFGWLSDRIGRKPLLLSCCLGFAVLSYPLFRLILDSASLGTIVAVQIVMNLFIAAFSGAGPAALAELFPTHSRTTLMSIGYSLSTAIFGGFAPFTATWLIGATGSPISPSLYLIAAAVASGLVIWRFRETAHDQLR
jgi:MHS family proline/betaine transporter-like MFS transporter